jgi:aspartyl-tRNA synthetase
MFFGADKEKIVNDAIGALRLKIGHSEFGKRMVCSKTAGLRCGWWTSRCSNTTKKPALHRRAPPLHRAQRRPRRLDGHRPEKCIAKGYDMVLNGWEMGGGSVRIHTALTCSKRCLTH